MRFLNFCLCILLFSINLYAERAAYFTFDPNSPVPGQLVTFNATGSVCSNSPCIYNWTDDADNSALGAGATFTFTFMQPGVKAIHLTIIDTNGKTSSIEHDVIVMNTSSAQGLAVKTWGPVARITTQLIYDGLVWSAQYCVGKQEFLPVGVMTPFGRIDSPRAGSPVMFNNIVQPTWLGCGDSWKNAFLAAKILNFNL